MGKKLVYFTPETAPQYAGEPGSSYTLTEQVYIPVKDQIEEMLLAGRMLDAYRKELYHFGPDEEVDEEFEDPTLHPSYDAAQAAVDRARLLGKRSRILREQAKAAEGAAKAAGDSKGSVGGGVEPKGSAGAGAAPVADVK